MKALDETDRSIVNRLQHGLAVSERPFESIAGELGISEYLLMKRLQTLIDDGVLAQVGPTYEPGRLAGAHRLAALAVPEERFDEIARMINGFDEVAHSYRRRHQLNMWFVLAADDPERIASVISDIERESGLKVHEFPKLQEYAVRTDLEIRSSPASVGDGRGPRTT